MNYFTATISVPLAEKLKEKGMYVEIVNDNTVEHDFPIEEHCETMFCEVFDWLMSRDFTFYIDSVYQELEKIGYSYYLWDSDLEPYYDNGFKTWHEAANAAIEKALTLI